MSIRLIGLALMLMSAGMFYAFGSSVAGPGEMTPPIFLLAAIAFLCGSVGAAALFMGPCLFEPCEAPRQRVMHRLNPPGSP